MELELQESLIVSPRKASTSRNADFPLAFGPTSTWKGSSRCDT